MEEQKKNSKEIKMNVPKKNTQDNNEEAPKYTYEQLKEIADKLFSENRYLKQQLYQASETIRMFNRLDYLFKVVENASVFNDMVETIIWQKHKTLNIKIINIPYFPTLSKKNKH